MEVCVRRRTGATLIELALALGLGIAMLVLAYEGFRFFTTRSASTTEEIMRARALGFFSNRLRRVLRFAVKVIPDGEGFVIVHLLVGEGGVGTLGESLVSLGGQPGEARWLEITPAGSSEAIRYEVGLDGLRLELKEEDGRVGVVVAHGDGIEPFPTRVRPLLHGEGSLVLGEGEDIDMAALEQEYAEGDWATPSELADAEAGRDESSGATERYATRDGIVPQPSGPTRNSLGLEADVFGVELSPLGRIFLPLTLEGGLDRLNAAEVTRILEGMGYPIYDATLLAVFLAGAELPDRGLRAASLGLFMSKLDSRSAGEQADILAAAHPAWGARANAEDEAAARSGEWGLYFPGHLLEAAGLGDEVVGAALDGGGDLPVQFGDLFDDPSEGGTPGWDVWQTAVGDGAKLPADVQANLPPDVRDRLNPAPGSDPAAGPGDPGDPDSLDPLPPGGAGMAGIGPGGLDIPVAVGPDYPSSVGDADLSGSGGIGAAIGAVQDLVDKAPDLSQASQTFDTATNDAAIRQAELDKAQSDFDAALTQWLSINHEYIQAREALQECQAASAARRRDGDAALNCGGAASEEARLDEELRLASVELETLEVALGEAQIAAEVANSSVENAEIHYENISNIIENRY